MFADPLTLDTTTSVFTTSDSVALPAISRGVDSSSYALNAVRGSSERWEIFIGHQFGKRNRTTMRITVKDSVTDPVTGFVTPVSNSYYVVSDKHPLFDPTTEDYAFNALATFMVAIGGPKEFDRIELGET